MLVGGSGNDEFVYVLSDISFQDDGRDIFRDFTRGSDELFLLLQSQTSNMFGRPLFNFLDTNDNHVLDGADRYVTLANVTDHGQTRASSIIEMGRAHDDLQGSSGSFGANDVIVVFNVTGIMAADFTNF